MKDELSIEGFELGREIAAVRGGRRRWRCPVELRRRVVAYARQRHASGWGWEEVARELGVGSSAVGRWVEREAREASGVLVPVAVRGLRRARPGG